MKPTRRHLISTATAALLLGACTGPSVDTPTRDSGPDSESDSGDTGEPADCPDPLADGTLVELIEFEDGDLPSETRLESGLDGRYAIDLETLDDEPNPTIPQDRFFIRTFAPNDLDDHALQVNGVETSLPDSQDVGHVLIECSGNGSNRSFGLISAASWAGVPVLDVLDADWIQVTGFDDHGGSGSGHSTEGCSWIFSRDQLEHAVLATHMNGEPLSEDHGAPVRLLIPGWYGCADVKWVSDLDEVASDANATSQMKEFASRTHQTAEHSKARDYAAAQMQVSAMPVRVERWELDGETVYRVVGILWGGTEITENLQIKLDGGWEDVTFCPAVDTTRTWTTWSHIWRPGDTGRVDIKLRVDADVAQVRLDSGYYERTVVIRG
ncbi:MAG: molybdopterin-dependent oxidoreductase [Proteobacteria bacterium]|nr:molybdopterin-dependent oxidoreductase [Pseudomonadota bacterium]